MRNRNTLIIGKVLFDFSSLPSTNQYAQELLAAGGLEEGTVISTRRQTHGKGQAGATWESQPDQNITLSVVLYPDFLKARAHFSLNQALALAVRDLVAAQVQDPVYIKWPNDIYICDGKTAGILVQTSLSGSRFQYCIAGIGINVNQTVFPDHLPNPVSLALAEGRQYDLPTLRQSLFLQLETRYLQLRAGESERIRLEYLRHLYRMETSCLFRRKDGSVIEGAISGVDEQGRLLIRHGAREEHFEMKEVSFAQ